MKLLNEYNFIAGSLLAVLGGIFDRYGVVLATFLIFNILDWATGTFKARLSGEESSAAGLKGICKKLGYWVLVFVAFMTGHNLSIIGLQMGILLPAGDYIGWLTLAMLVVNEARSITENLVEMGVSVPEVLTKGLAVTKDDLEKIQEETNK